MFSEKTLFFWAKAQAEHGIIWKSFRGIVVGIGAAGMLKHTQTIETPKSQKIFVHINILTGFFSMIGK